MVPEAELSRLYDAHAGAVFGYLLNLTRSEAETRDLLQELFYRLARRPELTAGVRDERAFLLRMAHNAVVDHARRHAARQRQNDTLAAAAVGLFAPAVVAYDDLDALGLSRCGCGRSFRARRRSGRSRLPPRTGSRARRIAR